MLAKGDDAAVLSQWRWAVVLYPDDRLQFAGPADD